MKALNSYRSGNERGEIVNSTGISTPSLRMAASSSRRFKSGPSPVVKKCFSPRRCAARIAFGDDQIGQIFSEGVLPGPSESCRGLRVPTGDAPLFVDCHDRVQRRVQDQPDAFCAFAGGFGVALPVQFLGHMVKVGKNLDLGPQHLRNDGSLNVIDRSVAHSLPRRGSRRRRPS